MKHVLSTHLIVNHRLTTAWLDRAFETGIRAVEIFVARQHLDYRNRAQIEEMGHWFADSEMTLHSLHAPMYTDEIWGRSGPQSVIDITEPSKPKRVTSVDEIKRTLEIAELIPFRYLIQHVGVGGQEYDERFLEAGFSSLEELSVFARQRGVEVLLENIPNQLSSAARLNLFLQQTHLDLNYCFDTGHAHLAGGVETEYNLMKTRIRSTHIHDNDGKADRHLFPTLQSEGTIDWAGTMPLLASRPEQYPLLLELKESPDFEKPLTVVGQIFDKLEELAVGEHVR
jgi:sugar phosphate isomerase/epimerase